MINSNGKFLFLLLFIGVTCMWTGCGSQSRGVPKKIVVATDATLPPMSFMNDQHKIDGFEIDLMTAITQQAGIELEMVNVEWAGLFGGLLTRKYDAAISSITTLEERQQKMDFSVPYLKSGLSIVVRKETEDIATLDDIQKNKRVVGAQLGTTAYFYLQDHPGIQHEGYQLYGHAVQDLLKGELDAVLGESTGTLYYKKNDAAVFEKIKMVGEILTEENYGIAVRKEDAALLEALNQSLKKLLADGTVTALHAKWELGRAALVPENSHTTHTTAP